MLVEEEPGERPAGWIVSGLRNDLDVERAFGVVRHNGLFLLVDDGRAVEYDRQDRYNIFHVRSLNAGHDSEPPGRCIEGTRQHA